MAAPTVCPDCGVTPGLEHRISCSYAICLTSGGRAWKDCSDEQHAEPCRLNIWTGRLLPTYPEDQGVMGIMAPNWVWMGWSFAAGMLVGGIAAIVIIYFDRKR